MANIRYIMRFQPDSRFSLFIHPEEASASGFQEFFPLEGSARDLTRMAQFLEESMIHYAEDGSLEMDETFLEGLSEGWGQTPKEEEDE